MIDATGKEQLLIKNPAENKSGFWHSYIVDDVLYEASSTEKETISIDSKESEKGWMRIVLNHTPKEGGSPIAKFDIEVWSYNTPVMLIRHKTTNLSDKIIKDMKLYNLMDFDVGGPSSYKDDIGIYEEESGRATKTILESTRKNQESYLHVMTTLCVLQWLQNQDRTLGRLNVP